MKYVIALTLFSMALPQMGNFGQLGYFPVVGCLILILVLNKQVYLSNQLWYNLGGGLCLAGMTVGTVLHGNLISFAYVFFGYLLFFFYPVFHKHQWVFDKYQAHQDD